MVVEHNEREAIAAKAKEEAALVARIDALEKEIESLSASVKAINGKALQFLLAAIVGLIAAIWEPLKAVIFK
jgi:hypothetical protein